MNTQTEMLIQNIEKYIELLELLEARNQAQNRLIKNQNELISLYGQKSPVLSFLWRLFHGRT